MATASGAGLALQRHVIPLVSIYNEMAEGFQVSLSRYVNIDGNTKEKGMYNVLLVSSPDVETLGRCVLSLMMFLPFLICHSRQAHLSFPSFGNV